MAEPNYWNANDVLTPADRGLARIIWDELRGKPSRRNSLAEAVPWLPASLEMLAKEGYGCADIGNMFGLRASAISMWGRKFGIHFTSNRTCSRVWCDIARKFVPIDGRMGRRLGIRDVEWKLGHRVSSEVARRTGMLSRKTPQAEICLRGHLLTTENRRKNGQCLTCARAHDKTPARRFRRKNER